MCEKAIRWHSVPGHFYLDAPIYFGDSMTITGTLNAQGKKLTTIKKKSNFNGNRVTAIYWDNGSQQFVQTTTQSSWRVEGGLIGFHHGGPVLKNLTIANLNVEGDSIDAEVDPSPSFRLSTIYVHGSNIRISNCSVRHASHMDIVMGTGSNNVLENCSIHNTARDGIFVGAYTNTIIRGNIITKTRDNAIGFDC